MSPDPRTDPPDWWDWELAFTAHLEARMDERQFSEVDLRTMVADAVRVAAARRPGRFIAETRLNGDPWVIVLEPDSDEKVVFVVTAYPRVKP